MAEVMNFNADLLRAPRKPRKHKFEPECDNLSAAKGLMIGLSLAAPIWLLLLFLAHYLVKAL